MFNSSSWVEDKIEDLDQRNQRARELRLFQKQRPSKHSHASVKVKNWSAFFATCQSSDCFNIHIHFLDAHIEHVHGMRF